ncbi:MAG: serine/threonine-protein kinase [Planctomycetota bacterium]
MKATVPGIPSRRSTGGTGATGVFEDTPRRVRLYALFFLIGYGLNVLQWQIVPFLTAGFWTGEMLLREMVMLGLLALLWQRAAGWKPAQALWGACVVQLLAVVDVTTPSAAAMTHFGFSEESVTPGISWSAVMIVIFPLLVPARPRVHALMAVAAVLLPVLINGLMPLFGRPATPAGLLWHWSIANAICAVLAIVCARLVHAMGTAVVQAQRELTRMGSYQLIARIGAGGMGEVWLGRHHMLAFPAAIKVINADRLAAEGRNVERVLERFEREAAAMASLRSTHTVEIYDYGRTDEGAFFYVMELLDGLDFDELVGSHGAQPCQRVVHLWRQLCLSMAEAHDQGLVHRDLKPANLYVCRMGCELDVVKVLDFGLVLRRRVGGTGPEPTADDPRLTEQQTVYGTPAFMAPEQAMDEPDVDYRADIYAMGCVMYFLLAGRPVFDEETAMKTMIAQVRKEPEPVQQVAGHAVPDALAALVHECLAKDRSARPADARAILARLRAVECPEPWTDEACRLWWDGVEQTHYTEAQGDAAASRLRKRAMAAATARVH